MRIMSRMKKIFSFSERLYVLDRIQYILFVLREMLLKLVYGYIKMLRTSAYCSSLIAPYGGIKVIETEDLWGPHYVVVLGEFLAGLQSKEDFKSVHVWVHEFTEDSILNLLCRLSVPLFDIFVGNLDVVVNNKYRIEWDISHLLTSLVTFSGMHVNGENFDIEVEDIEIARGEYRGPIE